MARTKADVRQPGPGRRGGKKRLLAIERRIALADLVKQDPVVKVDDLAKRFQVSAQTVRRDFESLEKRGLLTRTYGGAVTRIDTLLQVSRESAFLARQEDHAAEKRAMALTAVQLIEPESIVILDASTTIFEVARALPRDIAITAIVNALPIADELSRLPNVGLTFIGGTMRTTSLSFTGPISESALRRLFADTAFVSARGLSLERGLTEANPYETALKEIMVANATRVVAVVDSSKLNRTALSTFAETPSIDVLVTDDGADPGIVEGLRSIGVEVHLAKVC